MYNSKVNFFQIVKNIFLLKMFFLNVLNNVCFAQNLEQNVFMGIKNNKVYSRSGPGKEYPIVNIYIKRGEPVKILQKHKEWIKISDFDQEEGWIYKNLLSKKYFVIINTKKKEVPVFSSIRNNARVKFYLESKTRCKINKCVEQFCKIEYGHNQGWILKENLWGISHNISQKQK